MYKMNYEKAKELLMKDMEVRNYAFDTQSKFVRTLRGLCSFSNKLEDIETLDYSDVKTYLHHLSSEKEYCVSTINNYQAAIKFLFQITLKKPWNDESFPYLKLNKETVENKEAKSIYSNVPINGSLTYEETLHRLIIEMELRGLATNTQSSYLHCIKRFLEFTKNQNNPLVLTIYEVRSFLHNLQMVAKLNSQTININRTAIKFLFVNILNKDWDENKVPHLKTHKSVPVVLSKEEVKNLITAIDNDTYKTIALLMYSSGLRVSEAIKLRISDIDSKNMQLLISDGKRNKDRYAILSEKCLHVLRDYYRKYRPTNYLFEGQRYNLHISKESVQGSIRVAAIKCGINKKVTPHTLRHYVECF